MQSSPDWVDVVHFWLSGLEISPPPFTRLLSHLPRCGSSSQVDRNFNTPYWNRMIIITEFGSCFEEEQKQSLLELLFNIQSWHFHELQDDYVKQGQLARSQPRKRAVWQI